MLLYVFHVLYEQHIYTYYITYYAAIACMINTQSEEYTDFFSVYKFMLKHTKSDKTW